MDDVIVAKRCNGCMSMVAADGFHKNCKAPDGLDTQCIACRNDKARIRYARKTANRPKRSLRGLRQDEPETWVIPTHDYAPEDLALRQWAAPVSPGPLRWAA